MQNRLCLARCVALALSLVLIGCRKAGPNAHDSVAVQPTAAGGQPSAATRGAGTRATAPSVRSPGFRSGRLLDEHFAKHGREFGAITRQEYLARAQALRDAPAGRDVQEVARADGTVSRYERSSGSFVAFNRDGTIRTFFRPNDGETYFRRQARRSARP